MGVIPVAEDVDALGTAGELELGDPAAVLARNFLLIFMDVKRLVGIGVAIVAPLLAAVSADGTESSA
jgi:hypothetical protein